MTVRAILDRITTLDALGVERPGPGVPRCYACGNPGADVTLGKRMSLRVCGGCHTQFVIMPAVREAARGVRT